MFDGNTMLLSQHDEQHSDIKRHRAHSDLLSLELYRKVMALSHCSLRLYCFYAWIIVSRNC